MGESTGAVFLSYASQDADAARRIADALRAAGVEVWFDQSELVGGDQWDAKIRGQIGSCALFIPVISAATQARLEGYFRIEWKLAAQRTHAMADEKAFLLPLVIDATRDQEAKVPAEFRAVQWTKLPLAPAQDGKTGDQALAVFVTRVKRLLENSEVGAALRRDESQELNHGESGRKAAPTRKPFRWLIPAVVTVIAVSVFGFWRTSRQPELEAKSAGTSPIARSEARQLADKAEQMSLNKYNSTADDYATAEGLLNRALVLDENDADIWTISSLFNTSIRTRGFDHAPVRREMARRHAERAIKLAPNSLNALFAFGRTQRDTDRAAAETTFKKILEGDPNHADAMAQLAWIYDMTGRVDEAAELYERVLVLEPESAPLTSYIQFLLFFHYGRFEEADRAIRRSVALQPSANSTGGLVMLLLTWKGDAMEAVRVLAAAPDSLRNEPRMIWIGALAQLAAGEPEETLRTLQRLQAEYIQDNWYAGPKAYFAGLAHWQAGRKEGARIAWESALGTVDARLKTAPDNDDLHLIRGQILALLGRNAESAREAKIVDELPTGAPSPAWANSSVLIHAALGDADTAMPMLEQLLMRDRKTNVGWPLTPALLRIDPRWEKLRGDPRFQKLIVDGEARLSAAKVERDWPREPDLKRAMDLVNSYEAITEDYALAEDLALAKVEAKPSDPEAVTVMARVQSQILLRGFDRSDERYAKAKRYAERAQQLAPDEPEALYALAICLDLRGGAQDRVKALLSRAMTLAPTEPSYARFEARVYFYERPKEGVKRTEQVAAQFPNDVLAQYDLARIYRDEGRIADMEAALDRAIAIYPLTNAIVWKARMKLWVHGDPAGMKVLLDSVPVRSRGIDRVAISRYIYAMVSGETESGLEALRSLPNAWIEDFDFVGPKHMLQGELLLRAGKPELARLEFEAALAEVVRQKARAPTAVAPRSAEVWILHRLGRSTEARAGLALVLDAMQRPYRLSLYSQWMFQTPVLLLLMGEREQALPLLKEAAEQPVGRVLIGSALRFDPLMAPWRDDPEIRGLLNVTSMDTR